MSEEVQTQQPIENDPVQTIEDFLTTSVAENAAPVDGGISADDVVSETAPPEPTAPDTSILSGKLDELLGVESDPAVEQEAESERLKEQIRVLTAMKETGMFPKKEEEKKQEKAASPEIQGLQSELAEVKKLFEQQEQLRQQEFHEHELRQWQAETSAWVAGEKETFPLVNALNQQALVAQQILTHRQTKGKAVSEATAAREVEAELQRIGNALAPLLGWAKSEVKQSQSEDQVTINSSMSGTELEPSDWDKLSDDDKIRFLTRQSQG